MPPMNPTIYMRQANLEDTHKIGTKKESGHTPRLHSFSGGRVKLEICMKTLSLVLPSFQAGTDLDLFRTMSTSLLDPPQVVTSLQTTSNGRSSMSTKAKVE